MTTNCTNTFIRVAQDSALTSPKVPMTREKPSIAQLQYELLIERPYTMTSDDLLFEVHAIRKGISDDQRATARREFFTRSQACLRASPLPKTHGFGIHHDGSSRIALVPIGSEEYRRLSEDTALTQVHAMRSKRA